MYHSSCKPNTSAAVDKHDSIDYRYLPSCITVHISVPSLPNCSVGLYTVAFLCVSLPVLSYLSVCLLFTLSVAACSAVAVCLSVVSFCIRLSLSISHVSLSVCCLSVLSFFLSVRLSIRLPTHPSVHVCLCLPVWFCLSVCLTDGLSDLKNSPRVFVCDLFYKRCLKLPRQTTYSVSSDSDCLELKSVLIVY